MGDVLRAASLATGGAPLTGAYAKLSQWVQLVLANGSQTATTSCIQYNQNGSWVSGNCGTDYYYNGLGAGLHTYHGTATLDDKLDTALGQFGWTTNKTWNNAACFGIYRGIRPVKALASAIGLDATTYGGTSCLITPTSHTLSVSTTGTGSGTVTSSLSGISCGTDCSESYSTGTVVALSASAASGSTFAGWSGACSGTAGCQVTMDAAKAVSAAFNAPTAPPNLLTNPSFEQGTTGWTCNNCSLASELATVADGQKSASISVRAASWAGPTQTITQKIVNGKTYSVSGLAQTARTLGSTARFTFYLNTSAGVKYVSGPQASVPFGQFGQIAGTVTLQWSGTLLEARVYVETSGDAADFYLDQVVLSEVP
jgi:hypothetical protein